MGTNQVYLETSLGAKENSYTVVIDSLAWCWTTNDDDGLKLAVAVIKLKQYREVLSCDK